ncbi:MAG TPA: hypothetical protein VM580_33275 [Labilithrix sp.]|jgi:hypothetical protein|nr:hypothetical protein [Labilithrix sp.]
MRPGISEISSRFGWSRARALAATACLLALVGVGSSCSLDPVHSRAVENLGPEAERFYPPRSEYHRPGEPCALCHSEKGPAESTFVLGGTVYWGPDDPDARVDNAYVRVLDANKTRRCFVTNCNGNFFVRREEFSKITFPILVSVERTVKPGEDESTLVIRRMGSHIGREASCATCHLEGIRDFASPGQIRLFDTDQQFKDAKIPLVDCPPPEDYVELDRCPEDRN